MVSIKKWKCLICKEKCYKFQIDSLQLQIISTIKELKLKKEEIVFDNQGNVEDEMIRLYQAGSDPTKAKLIELQAI